MTAIRQARGCRASVMSFAVLWCSVMCLVQLVYMRCLSALQGLVWGQKKKKKISKALSSNWTWTSLFGRLTCNTRPPSFTINVYPTLPGHVCPHNPIIPDKIFHYLEYFQCRPEQSSFGSSFVHCSSNLCCSPLAATSICKVKYCTEVGFPYWSKWLVILWSYGPLLSVRCDCSDAYGPSLYIVQTLSRVREGSSHEMLLENEYDWSTAMAFLNEHFSLPVL